jgi:hypothetical protein
VNETRSPRLVHEAIWGPLLAAGFLAARFYPFAEHPIIVCPFRTLTSIPCLTCGGTRAVMALVRFDFARAFEMNPLVALAACGAFLYLLHCLRVLLTRTPWRPALPQLLSGRMRPLLVAAVVVNWGYLIAVGR